MPGTNDEIMALITGWPFEDVVRLPDHRWTDGDLMTPGEWADVRALYAYACRLREEKKVRDSRPQRQAMRLLRSLLTADQRKQLKRCGEFRVQAASGNMYRLRPNLGLAEQVERHGRNWYAKQCYCLHDEADANRMPPADVTVAHLLLLLADESAFTVNANARRRDDQLWNREYLRRVRRPRETVVLEDVT